MTTRIAVTGPRPPKLGGYKAYDTHQNIINHMSKLIDNFRAEYENIELISGMALGIDQFWAIAARAKTIPFLAAIPFEGFEEKWPQSSKNQYKSLLSAAKEVKYISPPGYHPSKMQIRNQWMVDNCDILVCYWDGTSGGTANCVKYADEYGKCEIVDVDMKQFNIPPLSQNNIVTKPFGFSQPYQNHIKQKRINDEPF